MKPPHTPFIPIPGNHQTDSFAPQVGSTAISVSELNRRVKGMLEANFELRWVRGEISNVMRAASGHWYFSLKDDAAQVRCVMFKQRAQAVSFTPENGLAVEVRALPSLYEARGEFQLGVETMRRAGLGSLFEAFERLKQKLAAEGLFSEQRKRPLPAFARTLGIVTSTKGAALHDVLTTLKRRAPMIRLIIYPTAVQGADAPREIAAAIHAARTRNEVDALLICRGGGSIEDLAAFNDEHVARAIVRLQTETDIAVVAGVGHETDFTICDFVADQRAPTPTAAAEMLSPDSVRLYAQLQLQGESLRRSATRMLHRYQQHIDFAARGLVSPRMRLDREREKIRQHQQRLLRAQDAQQRHWQRMQDVAGQQLQRAALLLIEAPRRKLAQYAQALNLLNPDQVLTRGYAMVLMAGGKKVVSSISGIKVHDAVTLRLHDGEIAAVVTGTSPAALPGQS